jgi:TetR/AcrR family fatty acid metabolism transcriptional regulator
MTKSDLKKAQILNAAEKIVSQKGLSETKIAAIAQEAGVATSVIYQYFKGKEDLVFSITSQRMEEVLVSLDEHLQGIKDAESRLGKMVWFHLRYNEINRGYARVFLLDCLFTKEFHASRAFEPVRKYARVLLSILREGVNQGRFRSDMDVRMARDVILGTLGCEVFMYSALKETSACVPDFEEIMSLILAMISSKAQTSPGKPDRILIAAEKVFSEKGFNKAKISEIANLAGVAEGTVYEYFENKEDLLLSVSEKRLTDSQKQLAELFHIKNPLRKLRRFIRYFFSTFFTNRDFVKVFLIEVQLSFRFFGSKAFELFQDYFHLIENIIEEGKSDGSFRPDVNPRLFRNMLIGTFNSLTLRFFILEGDTAIDKMEKIDLATEMLCRSVTTSESHCLSPP